MEEDFPEWWPKPYGHRWAVCLSGSTSARKGKRVAMQRQRSFGDLSSSLAPSSDDEESYLEEDEARGLYFLRLSLLYSRLRVNLISQPKFNSEGDSITTLWECKETYGDLDHARLNARKTTMQEGRKGACRCSVQVWNRMKTDLAENLLLVFSIQNNYPRVCYVCVPDLPSSPGLGMTQVEPTQYGKKPF